MFNTLKNMYRNVGNKTKALAVVSTAALIPATSHAQATGAEAVKDAIVAEVGTLEGYAWAILTVVVVAMIGIKLTKKFINRAS